MFYILIILLILSFSLNLIFMYVIRNLLAKIEIYEDWIQFFGSEIDFTYKRLKSVDNRQIFEKDDDVGFVFSELIRIMNEFKKRIE